jgi:hypothetical protein
MTKTAKTWRWEWDLANWSFRPMARSDDRLIPIDLEASEIRHRWIQGFLARLPALLGNFGYATEVEVNTRSKGDRAYVTDWRNSEGPSGLMTFIGQANDVGYVLVNLNLTCQGNDLEPIEIQRGAAIWVDILVTDSGALNIAQDHPVLLSVNLNADIYAPLSLGESRDNTLLAALNGPRLSSFLERFERDVPAELTEIYDDQYPGMIGPRGFKPPSAPATGRQ